MNYMNPAVKNVPLDWLALLSRDFARCCINGGAIVAWLEFEYQFTWKVTILKSEHKILLKT